MQHLIEKITEVKAKLLVRVLAHYQQIIVAEHHFRDEPSGQNCECQLMLPGTIFDGLELIPTQFAFGILVASLAKVAM